jgi:uncharacterized small protein (DUF1192 family)
MQVMVGGTALMRLSGGFADQGPPAIAGAGRGVHRPPFARRLAMARDDDDLDPRSKKPQLKNLDPMSIEDLRAYIAEMQAEIARVEDKIKAKQAHAQAAQSIFKR